jgi:excisionase family DNA binding protein
LENIHDELDRLLVLAGHKKLSTSTRTAPQTSKPVERLELTLPSKPAEKPSHEHMLDKLRAYRRMLTPDEAAEFLGSSRIKVIRMARAGKFSGVASKVGKEWRFEPTALARWIEGRRK